jgi:hypothetical protein
MEDLMRAAIYTTKGPAADVLRVIEKANPEPAAGEVRVKLAFSGVNPSDVKSRAGVSARGVAIRKSYRIAMALAPSTKSVRALTPHYLVNVCGYSMGSGIDLLERLLNLLPCP